MLDIKEKYKQRPWKHRVTLVDLLQQLRDLFPNELLRSVEIGVASGKTATCVLDHIPYVHHYMVDTWIRKTDVYEAVVDKTKFAGERAHVIRQYSTRAAPMFEDNFFHLVFIDAHHTYEAVKEDMEAWWPKCRNGGIFSGHDYNHYKNDSGRYGVVRAVKEFGVPFSVREGGVWIMRKDNDKRSGV